MHRPRDNPRDISQNRNSSTQAVLWLVLGILSIIATLAISTQSVLAVGEAMTRNTARLSLFWYWVAALGMLYLGNRDWLTESLFGKAVRWCWTWGAVAFLVHVVVAFQYYHHWSHTKAYEHVLHASNFGEGIYVSYFFTLLWTIDSLFWWIVPTRFANRPAWLGYAIHGFMLFIVFNATLVFESGAIRWFGALLFLSLTIAWVFRSFHSQRTQFE